LRSFLAVFPTAVLHPALVRLASNGIEARHEKILAEGG
jgi:hypothetical protein